MRYAIVSDIHANWQAWNSVLADAEGLGVDAIICLGDVVGYGPMPQAVLDSVRDRAAVVVLGNHDAAVCGRLDPSIFNDHARTVVEWTRQHIDTRGIQFLNDIPYAVEVEDALFVHSEILEPARFDYILEPAQAAEHLAACSHRIVFIGHTHHPTVFVLENKIPRECPADDFEIAGNRRYIVNVGSVGEPRDPEDLRARYAIYDTESKMVHFRGVHFDIDGYRADLQREGLNIQPYFLQVLAHEAGETLEPVIPETRSMTRLPVVPAGSHGQKPRRLVVAAGPATGSRPSLTVQKNQRPVARSPAPKAKPKPKPKPMPTQKTNTSNILLAVITAVIVCALIPVWYFALKKPDQPDEWEKRFNEARERRAAASAAAKPEPKSAPRPAAAAAAPLPKSTPTPSTNPSTLGAGLLTYWPVNTDLEATAGQEKPTPTITGDADKSRGKFGAAFAIHPNTGIAYGENTTYAVTASGLSASFWFQLNSPDEQDRHLIGTRSSGESDAPGWTVYANKEQLGAIVSAASKSIRSPHAELDGKENAWFHVALVIDPVVGVLQLYHNGTLASETDISNLGKEIPSADPLSIGLDPGKDNARDFHGKIDDLAIWSRPLNPDEIKEIFTGGSTPKAPLEKLLRQ